MSRLPYYLYVFYNALFKIGVPVVPRVFMVINRIVFGAYIPASCSLGTGVRFGYGGSGVVIHARAIVGRNCIIGTGVTIGGRSNDSGVPVIGDNVYISCGAKVLGDIAIGDNVVIGANAVVIKDVSEGCVVAGIPAKVIREGVIKNE